MIAAQTAQATVVTYNVTTQFYEPDTQPKDTIFVGSFDFDDVGMTVSGLHGILSESMTGDPIAYPGDNMTWLSLDHQQSAVYDAGLGGLLVTTFLNTDTNTLTTMFGGDGWSPDSHQGTGLYYGFPGANPANAYVRIFVNTTDPLAPLTQAQIDKLAYADCAPGGMMGATCMTGTTVAGYGSIGTMGGYPVAQTITAVPEPGSLATIMVGLGWLALLSRRRHKHA
jgi:hypothetical protein